MNKIFYILLLGMFLSQVGMAKSKISVEEVIKTYFKNVSEVKTKSLILSATQFKKVRNRAKTAMKTKVYRYYDIVSKGNSIGKALLMIRKVRTKKATVLYAFDKKGTLRFSEIFVFSEPPEFRPSNIWMSQLQEQEPSANLTVGKDIPTISGSTMSASSITEGARVARAIYEIVLKNK